MKKLYTAALFMMGLHFGNSQVFDTGDFAYMFGVSNNGVAAGNVMYSEHIMWTEESGTVTIGQPLSGEQFGGQNSVSVDGKYISGTMTNPETMADEMARYDTTTQQWLYAGALTEGLETSAWGMSADGKTLVGLGFMNEIFAHAVQWTEGGTLMDLGSSIPETSSRANGISDDGSIIVGWQDDDLNRNGVYWNKGEQVFLKDGDGENVGEVTAVSGNGKTMVGETDGWPYIWTEADGYQEFPHQDPMMEGGASAVNGNGDTVVGYYRPWGQGAFGGSGFIWTKEGGMKDLNVYVAELGIDDQGMNFALPLGISRNGKYIVGIGTKGVDVRGFVIKLPDSVLGTETAVATKTKVYPNPVKDILHITKSENVSLVEVYNMAGQKVFSTTSVTKSGLNLSALPAGSYVLQMVVNGIKESTTLLKR